MLGCIEGICCASTLLDGHSATMSSNECCLCGTRRHRCCLAAVLSSQEERREPQTISLDLGWIAAGVGGVVSASNQAIAVTHENSYHVLRNTNAGVFVNNTMKTYHARHRRDIIPSNSSTCAQQARLQERRR